MRKPVVIATRRDLAGYLEGRMTRSYTALRGGQRLPYESSLVKTYMVEAHLPGGQDHDDLVRLLHRALSDEAGPFKGKGWVHESEEGFFVRIDVAVSTHGASLYVDASNPRFWLVHSMGESGTVDWCVERLTTANPELDRAWLPVELLEWVSGTGSFRGLGLDYDRRAFLDREEEDEQGVTFLKMQLWGNRAKDILGMLRRDGAFPHETTLSKVKVKFWLDGDGGG